MLVMPYLMSLTFIPFAGGTDDEVDPSYLRSIPS